jgi:hypothetical protein
MIRLLFSNFLKSFKSLPLVDIFIVILAIYYFQKNYVIKKKIKLFENKNKDDEKKEQEPKQEDEKDPKDPKPKDPKQPKRRIYKI